MNIKNLGIYISRQKAAAVLTTMHDCVLKVESCFTEAAQAEGRQYAAFAEKIAAELAARQIQYDGVSIALDCTYYTQHDIHSGFTDYRQIAQTIRFDVEEMLGDDANRMAIAFSIVKTDDNGSVVTVFSVLKDELSQILTDFQSHGIDPEVIEPDVVAFARAVSVEMGDNSGSSTLFAAFGEKVCYNAVINTADKIVLRSFLYPESADKTDILCRQLKLTLARNTIAVPVDTLCVFNNDMDKSTIAYKTGLNVPEPLDLMKKESVLFAHASVAAISQAVAAGASVSHISRRHVDFRQDFSPYQGKKRVIEISLRLIALAASILLCAVAVNHTLDLIKIKSDTAKVEQRTQDEYSSAMKGKKMASKAAVLTLKGEASKLKKIKSGEDGGDDGSIASRLRYILEAINSVPADVNLKIDSITVSDGMMRLDGSTNSRPNTQKMLSAIDTHKKLKRAQESLQQNGSVDSFNVNIELVK